MKHGINVEERYFLYLCRLVEITEDENSPGAVWALARQLHQTPFAWVLPDDVDRAEDALDLREEFVHNHLVSRDEYWIDMDVSLLEVLVALARRAAYQTDQSPGMWYRVFLDNLGLLHYVATDTVENSEIEIDDILATFMYRSYQANGVGGLFPLRSPKQDQRHVSIWDQKSAYVIEEMETLGFLDS